MSWGIKNIHVPGYDAASRAINNLKTSLYGAKKDIDSKIDSKIVTFFQASEPTSSESSNGDIWIDTDDSNKMYIYNNSSWTSARDVVASWSELVDDDGNRPDANADVTADNNNWSEVSDDDSNKPDNNADVTADNNNWTDISGIPTGVHSPVDESLSKGAWDSIAQVTITPASGSNGLVAIGTAKLDITSTTTGTTSCPLRLRAASTTIGYNPDALAYGASADVVPLTVSCVRIGLTGSTTIIFDAYNDSSATVYARDINLMVQEIPA
ncbi:MAG: hypothetical protein U9M89_02860 [Patescibacteria group bacterium]|nr:hypothetical protein [Patescibacteria group bacterium]